MTDSAPPWPSADVLVPVLVIDDAIRSARLAAALLDGGVTCAEITLRTPAAMEAAARVPGLRVGAGTVLTVGDVDRVVDAGARFVVSPGLDDDVVERCHHHGVTVVATATEAVFAVSGSWLASRAMIVEADLAAIERLCRDAVELVDP